MPPAGIPGPILEAACRFPGARAREHREALARIETGLLRLGAARIRGEHNPLPEKRWAGILAEKLERGEWLPLRMPFRYRDASQAWRTMPGVFAIARPYALELIDRDTGARYADYFDYLNGRPLKHREPLCYNMPADLGEYLEAGTGLLPDHATALRILDTGGKPVGWRVLALEPAGLFLRPSWCGKECGRVYALRPALQALPKRYRREALYPAGSGEGFAELDFSCCQPNIARILTGQTPSTDLYSELASASGMLTREQVKSMVLPILHGRTRGEHVHLYGRYLAPLYDNVRAVLPIPGEDLQRIEADILRAILRRMRAAGIPAGLPLHDSILTAFPVPVAGFMREESERKLGHPLPVKITPAGPGLDFS